MKLPIQPFLVLLVQIVPTCHSYSGRAVPVPVSQPLKFYNGCALKRLVSDNDRSNLRHFWQNLLRPMLVERVPGTDGNKRVQQHIIKHFAGLPLWSVDTDTFTDGTPNGLTEFTNIIVTQLPERKKKLTLACHHDSKFLKNFIGATDSAVPCSMLLDLANRLDYWLKIGNGNQASDYSLRLLFFDGEEAFRSWTSTDSLYGARHLAEKWATEADTVDSSRSKLQTIAVFILLDLIGEAGMNFHNFFAETTPLFEALEKTENKLHREKLLVSGRRMFSTTQLVNYHSIDDDHKPFLNRGVPVLHLISTPFPSAWHTSKDNEENLSWQEIDNVNRIIRVFIAQFLHLKVKGCDRDTLRPINGL